jgi:hypothetical protein
VRERMGDLFKKDYKRGKAELPDTAGTTCG